MGYEKEGRYSGQPPNASLLSNQEIVVIFVIILGLSGTNGSSPFGRQNPILNHGRTSTVQNRMLLIMMCIQICIATLDVMIIICSALSQ
jgi:hypothetical protein